LGVKGNASTSLGWGRGKAVELLDRGHCDSRQCGETAALSKPRPNAVKFFNSIELIALLANPDWLDDATKTIIHH
jgi:hypothetical protein